MLIGLPITVMFLCNIGSHYESIGTYTGAVVFYLLFQYGLTPDPFQSWWKKQSNVIKRILQIITVLILFVVITTLSLMAWGAPQAPGEEERTVIILGSGINHDGTPSMITKERVDAALPYIKAHPDAAIIPSGGLYSSYWITESESMHTYLLDQGVDESRIYIEKESTSTMENLRNSAKVIREENLNSNVVIVTSEFHSYRAGLYARRNGLSPAGIFSKTEWWVKPACVLREIYGILDAWILHR